MTNENFWQVQPVMLLEIEFDVFQLHFRQTWVFPHPQIAAYVYVEPSIRALLVLYICTTHTKACIQSATFEALQVDYDP